LDALDDDDHIMDGLKKGEEEDDRSVEVLKKGEDINGRRECAGHQPTR